jgi:hypothetical protein
LGEDQVPGGHSGIFSGVFILSARENRAEISVGEQPLTSLL